MAYGTFTLTGKHQLPDGTADAGTAHIKCSTVLRDAAGDVILSGALKVTLDGTGAWSKVLPAADVSLQPQPHGFTVTPRLHTGSVRPVTFAAPAAGTTLNLADIADTVLPPVLVPNGATAQDVAAVSAAVVAEAVTARAAEASKVSSDGADVAVAAFVGDPASATSTELMGTYLTGDEPPLLRASLNGILYDGTDETAAFQALVNTCQTFGVGVIELEAVVRCDAQIVIPNSGGTQPRQAPLRITGTGVYMPGSTFTGVSPFPKASGLDLRYAGRTDTGCATTLGSPIIDNPAAVAGDRGLLLTGPGIPDQCWVLAVTPGVGYSVLTPARATAAGVSLTTFGGRLQTLGYGNLEIDHVQLMNNGAVSSAPFVLSTATKVNMHDCLVLGHSSKSDAACDEDPLVMGGQGQGTALTTPLTNGNTYTTLTVAPTPVDTLPGVNLKLVGTNGVWQTVVSPTAVLKGATSVTVTSFVASADYPARTPVYIGDWQAQVAVDAWSVPSALFQGYGSRVHDNHFHRVRRVVAGGFTTSVSVDHNSYMHHCGSNLAALPSTLTTALTSGVAYTALAVTALSRALIAGDVIQVGGGATSQETVASAPAAAGATSISVTSFTATATYAIGVVVFNATAGIGAMVESYATGGSANAVNVTFNRMGFSGGYTHATRSTGPTTSCTIEGNDFQDTFGTNMIAGHRFDRAAQYNLVIPGLMGTQPTVDDWANATHERSQTVLEHSQSRPSSLPQGLDTVGTLSRWLPAVGSTVPSSPAWQDSLGNRWTIKGASTGMLSLVWTYQPVGGAAQDVMQIDCNGVNVTGSLNCTNNTTVRNRDGHLIVQSKAAYKLSLGDATYPSNVYVLNSNLVHQHLVASGAIPTVAAAGASTGVSITGQDGAHTVTLTTAAGLAVDGAAATVTYNFGWSTRAPNSTPRFAVTPKNGAAAGAQPFVTGDTATGYSLALHNPPAGATALVYDVQVIGAV